MLLESVVLGYKIHIVGKIRRVWSLNLHIPFNRIGLASRVKQNRQLEKTARDLHLSKIFKTRFKADEVIKKLLLGYSCAVVVNQQSCRIREKSVWRMSREQQLTVTTTNGIQ